jgi:hypothetical protein
LPPSVHATPIVFSSLLLPPPDAVVAVMGSLSVLTLAKQVSGILSERRRFTAYFITSTQPLKCLFSCRMYKS